MRILITLWIAALAAGLQPETALRRTAIDSGQPPLMLTDFAFTPDGGMITTGKNGTLAYLSPDGERSVLANIPVVDEADLGLVAIELAPDFSGSGRIHTSYTYADGGETYSRLSTWRVDPIDRPTRLVDEDVVLDRIPQDAPFHSIGSALPIPGGLLVGVGDGTRPLVDLRSLRAQDPDAPNGKILRITPDGAGMPGNPFYDPSDPFSWRSRVYALGLRNPFRLTLRPATGSLYVADVGWRTWEEINVVEAGDNLGWPCWEGPETTRETIAEAHQCRRLFERRPPIEDPLFAYEWGEEAGAIIGGVFAPPAYPPGIRGAYLFGDFVRGEVRALRVDGADRLMGEGGADLVISEAGGPVRFRVGHDGLVYYADILEGKIWRLDPVGAAPAGAALAAAVATIGLAALSISLYRRRSERTSG